MAEQRLTLSNLLSVSRIVLVAPFGYALSSGSDEGRVWGAAIMGVAILTDFLDGFFARRLHQVTELGKIVDPLSDKISVGLVALILAWHQAVPWWYLGVVLMRDLLILAGGVYIKRKKNIVVQSNWPGKVAVSLIALVLILSIFPSATETTGFQVAFWASIVLMVVSLALYAQRLFIGRSVRQTV